MLGDAGRLRQILNNLLGNAVKFTSEGEIVVRVRPADRPAADRGRVRLHISVRDSGIGIPADRVDRLFQSFSQVDASTTRKFGGTGLGLAISKQLAELMDGAMWVESIEGEGSTFQFEVEFERGTPPAGAEDDNLDARNILRSKRILAVDDNETNRTILAEYLSSWGLDHHVAQSADEAIVLRDRHGPFDVALLDVQMPGVDGIKLTHWMRERQGPDDLAVVFLTSLGRNDFDSEGLDLAGYMNKPIKPSALFDMLIAIAVAEEPTSIDETVDDAVPLGLTHPLRILLAEDNQVNQMVATGLLQKHGFAPDVVDDGRAAVNAFAENRYDLILMDNQMPELDGVSAMQEIRAGYPDAEQPWIIALTANALEGDRERFLAAGMDDYVSKPIQVDILLAALRKAWEKRNPGLEPISGEFMSGEPISGETASGETAPVAPAEPVAASEPVAADSVPIGEPVPMSEAKAEVESERVAPGEVVHEQREIPTVTFDEPVLATEVLSELAEMFGDGGGAIVADIIDTYLEEAPDLIGRLRVAIAEGDADGVREAAHALKSSSANVGVLQISAWAKHMESAGRDGDLATIAEVGTQLDQVADAAVSALRAWDPATVA